MTVQPPILKLSSDTLFSVCSFLDADSLKQAAAVSKAVNAVSSEDAIWKPLAEKRFGFLAQGTKQPGKSWKETYRQLEGESRLRQARARAALSAHATKIIGDDARYRTERAAAAMFGIPAPLNSTHYIPTGQTGFWQGRKITVFQTSRQ